VLRLRSIRALATSLDELVFGDRAGTAVELRYAKGWVYFDDPDGGPQERVPLREARSRFRVGQMIEIGHSTIYSGGYDRGRIQLMTAGGIVTVAQFKFRGTILLRVNPYRSADNES
jgi:hypothetical protein